MKQPYSSQRRRLFPRPGARLFVWVLLAGLVLMNGLAVLSLSHAVQHESHNAGMHHTGLCAWLCAAGQAAELASVQAESASRLADFLAVQEFILTLSATILHAFLRGPPASAA